MKKILASIGIILTFFAGAHVALAGFGITPPYVRNEALTRGSEYVKEITLVRGDPVEDLKAEVTVNIPGADGWFSIDRGTEFILPQGEKQVPIKITVRVPDNAEYATYAGSIRIRTSSLEQRSGVSIALGAQIDVTIKVVDKIYDFEVRRVELKEAEQGYKKWWLDFPGKITLLMHIENTGNAPVAPDKVAFGIYDRKSDELLESVKNIGKIQTVAPFDTQKVSAYLPTFLEPGGYKVKYTIYKDEGVVARTGDLNLSILPRGVIPGYEPFGFEALSFWDKASIIGPIVGFVLLLLGLIFWLFTSKGKGRRHTRRKKSASHSSEERTAGHHDTSGTAYRSQTVTRRGPSSGNVIDLSRRK